MTIINIGLKVPTPAGPVGAEGRVNFQRVDRLVDGSVVLLPARTSVALVAGVASVDLAAGVYWVDEVTPGGTGAFREVPVAGPVDYATLPALDPATLDPAAPLAPAWTAAAATFVRFQDANGASVPGKLAVIVIDPVTNNVLDIIVEDV